MEGSSQTFISPTEVDSLRLRLHSLRILRFRNIKPLYFALLDLTRTRGARLR